MKYLVLDIKQSTVNQVFMPEEPLFVDPNK